MAHMRLTDVVVERVKPSEKRIEYWDTITTGLVLRVMPTGHKSWCFAYRERGVRQQQRMTLGSFPEISLSKAREIAKGAREDLAMGIDPIAKRLEKIQERRLVEQESVTVEKMSQEFVENYAKPRNRSWKQTQQSFTKYINPDLGETPAKDVKRKDVVQLLDKLKSSKHPHTANQVLVALRKMYNWAIERDELDFNPCHAVKKPVATRERERVLSRDEIKSMWKASDDIGYPYGPMFKMLLLTGARRSEMAKLEWHFVDLQEKVIRLPASLVKSNRGHEIPLSNLAIEILKELPRFKGSYVFSTTYGQKACDGFSKMKLKFDKTMKSDDWRIHDLRRTCATGLAEAEVPIHTISRILNHAEGGVTRLYARHSYLKEKRAALDLWATKVNEMVRGVSTTPEISAKPESASPTISA